VSASNPQKLIDADENRKVGEMQIADMEWDESEARQSWALLGGSSSILLVTLVT